MAARVSTGQYLNGFVNQIFDVRSRLETTRNQISTGVKVNTPSDDPGRSGTIVNLQNLSQRIDRHADRVVTARIYLETQEQVVTSANDVLIRAEELATQAANETYTRESRKQIGAEIFQLRDQLASLANTKSYGVYIYGGLDDGDTPFDAQPAFYPTPAIGQNPSANTHYQLDSVVASPGQDTTRSVRISDTESIRINTAAKDVFLDAINALERLGRALEGSRTDLIDADGDGAIDDPDPAGTHLDYTFPGDYSVQSADIRAALNAIQSARSNNLETELSSIGARTNRLNQTEEILATLKDHTETSRAAIQDADIFEASASFTNLQTSLEALLSSGSRISNLSLLDYL